MHPIAPSHPRGDGNNLAPAYGVDWRRSRDFDEHHSRIARGKAHDLIRFLAAKVKLQSATARSAGFPLQSSLVILTIAPWQRREARSLDFITEATMFIAGVILGFVAIGYSCRLLFALAVNALPFFVGLTTALAADQRNSGAVGAIVVGLVAGIVTLAAGRGVFVATRSPGMMRAAIALLFAAPAAVAGYHGTLGLAHIGAPSQGWREIFSVIGAIVVGGTAWARMAL
jgi:hypothetical protein